MTQEKTWTRELGLLRRVVQNLSVEPLQYGPISLDAFRNTGFAKGKFTPIGYVGIRWAGAEAFSDFCSALFARDPKIKRGSDYPKFEHKLLSILLTDYLEAEHANIDKTDVESINAQMVSWFAENASKKTILIPCVISPWPSPSFSIGPVQFIFLADIRSSTSSSQDGCAGGTMAADMNRLLEEMENQRAHWLAQVEIRDCDQQRSIELTELTVDLAIVAIQLATGTSDAKRMSRLSARRGSTFKLTISTSEARRSVHTDASEPGMTLGPGTLEKILKDNLSLVNAVAEIITSFATNNFRFLALEGAWCDAAYWFHQGLAEPLDTIAIAKLETSIEVLLRSEKTSGSRARVLAAFEGFCGLSPDQPVFENYEKTVQQFATDLVEDRSRFLHGTWSTLREKPGTDRASSELVAAYFLTAYALELKECAKNTNSIDRTDVFMDWTKTRRNLRLISNPAQPTSN